MFEQNPKMSSFEELFDAMILSYGDYAAQKGFDAQDAQLRITATLALESERSPVHSPFRKSGDKYRSRPEVVAEVARQRDARDRITEVVRQAGARRALARSGRQISSARMVTLETAAGDVIDAISDATIEYPTSNARTDTVVGSYVSYLSGPEMDTLYAVEDLSDSSRVFWEQMALDLWIGAGGDTTIFNPVNSVVATAAGDASRNSCGDQAIDIVPPSVVACPVCIGAAIFGATGDAVAAFSSLHAGNSIGYTAVEAAGVSLITGVGAYAAVTAPAKVAGLIGRIGSWIGRTLGS